MTYAEKLHDGRWWKFRAEFLSRQPLGPDGRHYCFNCGYDYVGSLQIHHRRYILDKDPWDYEDSDLLLLCDKCHNFIHKVEERARDLIRGLDSHEAEQFDILMDELEAARTKNVFKSATAHAKNAVRCMMQ